MTRILSHLRGNAVAYLALFVALGGTSYAALQIPNNSVGTKQLKNGAVTPAKLNSNYFNGNVRAWAVVTAAGKVAYGAGKPTATATGVTPGSYEITWGVKLPKHCATIANVDGTGSSPTETVSVPGNPAVSLPAGFVVVGGTGSSGDLSATQLRTFDQSGKPTPLTFDVVVTC